MTREIDKNTLTVSSERARLVMGFDEPTILTKLMSEICREHPEFLDYCTEDAKALVEEIVLINQDLLPKLSQAVRNRRETRGDSE